MNSDSPDQINSNASGSEATEQATSANASADTGMSSQDYGAATTDTAPLDSPSGQTAPEIEAIKNQYMRIAADFENYRKRTAKEKDDLDAQVKRNTITELLPVSIILSGHAPISSPKTMGK